MNWQGGMVYEFPCLVRSSLDRNTKRRRVEFVAKASRVRTGTPRKTTEGSYWARKKGTNMRAKGG